MGILRRLFRVVVKMIDVSVIQLVRGARYDNIMREDALTDKILVEVCKAGSGRISKRRRTSDHVLSQSHSAVHYSTLWELVTRLTIAHKFFCFLFLVGSNKTGLEG